MPKSNQNSKPFLIFPENSASIIANILKKYGLKESNKEILEKWKGGQKSSGAILTDLLIKMTKSNLSTPNLIDLIKKELNIPPQKAKAIMEDLTREIIVPATQISKKIPSIGKLLSLRE